jgi:uncharacterized protein YwqG
MYGNTEADGFVSFYGIKKKLSSSKKRKHTAKQLDKIAIVQSYEIIKTPYRGPQMTVKLSNEMLAEARMKVGDIVDMSYNSVNDTWKIEISSKNNGYKISQRGKNAGGVIRFSLLDGMKVIDNNDTIKNISIKADNKTIHTTANPLSILFKLDYNSKNIKYKI